MPNAASGQADGAAPGWADGLAPKPAPGTASDHRSAAAPSRHHGGHRPPKAQTVRAGTTGGGADRNSSLPLVAVRPVRARSAGRWQAASPQPRDHRHSFRATYLSTARPRDYGAGVQSGAAAVQRHDRSPRWFCECRAWDSVLQRQSAQCPRLRFPPPGATASRQSLDPAEPGLAAPAAASRGQGLWSGQQRFPSHQPQHNPDSHRQQQQTQIHPQQLGNRNRTDRNVRNKDRDTRRWRWWQRWK